MDTGLVFFCKNCDSHYTLTKEHLDRISEVCAIQSTYETVIKCSCGYEMVVVGEKYHNGDPIDFYTTHYDDQSDEHDRFRIETFDALMLTECSEDNHEKVAAIFNKHANRLLSLKPGKPNYIFRNLPINHPINDPYGIRWCVSGEFQDSASEDSAKHCGVLEWGVSFIDAILIRDKMRAKTAGDPKAIYVEMYGVDEYYVDYAGNDRFHIKPVSPNFKYHASIGDLVACYVVFTDTFTIGIVTDIERRIVQGDLIRLDAFTACRQSSGDATIFGDIWYDVSYVKCVLDRPKARQQPDNHFRNWCNDLSQLTTPISRIFAQLPFPIPYRLYVRDIIDRFTKQYPLKANGRLNTKLLKRWIRQNWSKLLLSKKEMVAIEWKTMKHDSDMLSQMYPHKVEVFDFTKLNEADQVIDVVSNTSQIRSRGCRLCYTDDHDNSLPTVTQFMINMDNVAKTIKS